MLQDTSVPAFSKPRDLIFTNDPCPKFKKSFVKIKTLGFDNAGTGVQHAVGKNNVVAKS